jgi:hypothetical protein
VPRLLWAICASAVCLVAAAPAHAATIGQLAPGTPASGICGFDDEDIVQTTVTSGNSYVVPPFGARIVSWSTNASMASGNQLRYTLKVFRKLGPGSYRVVAHDGPRTLVPSTLNTFAVDLAVQPGDIIGLHWLQGGFTSACEFVASSTDDYDEHFGNLEDGSSANDFISHGGDYRVNISAVVKPSNQFTLGKVTNNRRRGTATVAATVPGPGVLSVAGKGVKPATASGITVTAPGTVTLTIRARGKSKRRLATTGRAKVKPSITYTPTDGDPNTEVKKVKLKRA